MIRATVLVGSTCVLQYAYTAIAAHLATTLTRLLFADIHVLRVTISEKLQMVSKCQLCILLPEYECLIKRQLYNYYFWS